MQFIILYSLYLLFCFHFVCDDADQLQAKGALFLGRLRTDDEYRRKKKRYHNFLDVQKYITLRYIQTFIVRDHMEATDCVLHCQQSGSNNKIRKNMQGYKSVIMSNHACI